MVGFGSGTGNFAEKSGAFISCPLYSSWKCVIHNIVLPLDFISTILRLKGMLLNHIPNTDIDVKTSFLSTSDFKNN